MRKGEYYIKGNDTRSFCYVDDAVEITHRLVMEHKNAIVNVGRQEEHYIADVAKLIMEIMGVDPDKLEIVPGPKGSAKRRCPNTTLMQRLTNFTNYTSIRDGLKTTVESLL